MERKEIRRLARQRVKESWSTALLPLVLQGLLMCITGPIALLLAGPLTLGAAGLFLRYTAGEKPKASEIFSGFSRFGTSFATSFLVNLYVCLWTLLLYIPGVVKSYSYSMAFYVLAENQGMGANAAIRESMRRMKGHRMELFLLQLSFVGWWLLCVLTCGLAGLYVAPYYSTAMAIFYRSLPKTPDAAQPAAAQPAAAQQAQPEEAGYRAIPAGAGVAADTEVLTPSQQINCGMFQGMGGSLRDQCFGLPAGDLFAVGRDAQRCGILVDAANGTVSRCHCTIQYMESEQMYYLTDLSVNGTYVGEMRLPKGEVVRIAPGTVVSLGDGRESFRLG